jgi:hypothetical protein
VFKSRQLAWSLAAWRKHDSSAWADASNDSSTALRDIARISNDLLGIVDALIALP